MSSRGEASRGEIARARSAVEAAQSDLHTIELKLAPLAAQRRRALAKLVETRQALRVAEGVDAPAAANDPAPRALVELARIYEGFPPSDDATPCDVEARG